MLFYQFQLTSVGFYLCQFEFFGKLFPMLLVMFNIAIRFGLFQILKELFLKLLDSGLVRFDRLVSVDIQ